MSPFKTLLQEWHELDWPHNKWLVIYGIIAISPAIGGIPSTQPIYYAALLVAVAYFLTQKGKLNFSAVIFLVAGILSVVLNNPPALFKAPIRLALFSLVFLVASPLLQGDKLCSFRLAVLTVILKMSVIVSFISFVFYFAGINFMAFDGTAIDVREAGGFGGLTRQSMLLGPISGTAVVYVAFKAFQTKNRWYWLAAIPCAGCTMFAASRAAFLAAIAGVLAMFYTYSKSYGQFIKIILTVFFVGAVTFPLWNGAMNALESKNNANIETESMTASRNSKWNNRLAEFESSPLFGIGFATCDLEHTEDYNAEGGIESGSSWLTILSTMGLIGFIAFIFMMKGSIHSVFRRRTRESALLMGLLTFISLHMMAEGYIIYGGSQLCFTAWLIIGCCYDNRFRPRLLYSKC